MSATSINPVADAAIQAAGRGWFVTPFRVWRDEQGDKQSKGYVGWKDNATTDVEQIARWWKQWPDAVIGLVTKPSHLLVIDLDLHDPEANGLANWQELLDQHNGGEWIETYTVNTPTGGLHLYFAYDGGDIKNSASKLAPGVDVRGAGAKSGGIIFGAGSVRFDGVYAVENAADVAPLPVWLRELLVPQGAPERAGAMTDSPWTPEQAYREIERVLENVKRSENGHRNNSLNNAALRVGRFVAGGFLGPDEARQLLEMAGNKAGLDRDEVRKTVASGLYSHKAKSEPMVQSGEQGAPEVIVPVPTAPLKVARKLEPGWDLGGARRLHHWRGQWMYYEDGCYTEYDPQQVQNALWMALEHAKYLKPSTRDAEGRMQFEKVAWNPTTSKIRDVHNATMAVHALDPKIEPGQWVQGEGPTGLISTINGLLNPATMELLPHTANYFAQNTLPFEYDSAATCSAWDGFLESVWPGDDESKALLQEWFGYVISGRTDMEKMMFFKGASRSGKGVTSRVLGQLLGADNVAGPTFSSFGQNFGLQSLIAKPLAVIDDARSSMRVDIQAVIERLLTITGRGRLDIDRKNKTAWTGVLPTRVMMLSNELPWFRDASGAITGRMLMLVFPNSFLGKEDRTLDARLVGELPGILNWALKGLERIAAQGRFTQPQAGAEEMQELADQVSPIGAFIREKCELGEGLSVRTDVLFSEWQRWSGDDDMSRAAETRFGTQVRNAPGTTITRKKNGTRDEQGRLKSLYEGITLRRG